MNRDDPEVESVLLSNAFSPVFTPATVTQNTTVNLGLVTTLLLSLLFPTHYNSDTRKVNTRNWTLGIKQYN